MRLMRLELVTAKFSIIFRATAKRMINLHEIFCLQFAVSFELFMLYSLKSMFYILSFITFITLSFAKKCMHQFQINSFPLLK